MSTESSFSKGTLTITRLYDAPREAVFDAWIETSKVQQWWGCAQTTAVRSEIEPKIGGVYNHHMTLGEMGEFPGDVAVRRPWRSVPVRDLLSQRVPEGGG